MGSWLLLGTDSLIACIAVGIGIAYAIPSVRRHMWVANGVAGGAMLVAAGVLYAVG